MLIVDANILIRAVLGYRVLLLLQTYAGKVRFLTAEVAFASAHAYLPDILVSRGLAPQAAAAKAEREVLGRLPMLVSTVPEHIYADREQQARRRLRRRDESDWPYLALALTFDCPVWTEDRDFFGSGVATWTTDRVEIYLSESG
jgi:predicted nucleic acid-binding protein